MNKLLQRISQQKADDVRQELARAHLIVALLSLIIIVLLLLCSTGPVTLNATLSFIGGLLLGCVALISLSISITLFMRRNTIKKKN